MDGAARDSFLSAENCMPSYFRGVVKRKNRLLAYTRCGPETIWETVPL